MIRVQPLANYKPEVYFNNIAWPEGQDFSPDTVYMRSALVKTAAPALID